MTNPRLVEALAALHGEVKRAEVTLARLAESGTIDEQLAAAAGVHGARLRLKRDAPAAASASVRESAAEALSALFEADPPDLLSEAASGPATPATGAESGSTQGDPAPAEIDWTATDEAIATRNTLTT